jgi:alpha-glucosidase (family GH31 glycosyl hydrolase)
MDLSNRQFTLSATDCFGYDALRTDPMYKHIPLLIKAGPEGVVGTFSTSHARGSYSVGSEMDGMWGFYKVYRQDHGGLEEYTMVAGLCKKSSLCTQNSSDSLFLSPDGRTATWLEV